MQEIDDCNLRFIDSAAIKRFLIKCRVYPSDDLLIAVVRRLDLDADARLSYKEFRDGVLPLENFTKTSLKHFKSQVDATKIKRPHSAAAVKKKPSKLSDTLHGRDTQADRDHRKQDDVYQKGYNESVQNNETHYMFNNEFVQPREPRQPPASGFTMRASDHHANCQALDLVDRFNKHVIREIIGILRKLEVDRSVLVSRPDFTI